MTHEPLLDALTPLLRQSDPVPLELLAAARAAPAVVDAWRRLDAGQLEMVADSARELEPAGLRGEGGHRLLTFVLGTTRLRVRVVADRRRLNLIGLVEPAAGSLRVRWPAGEVGATVDTLGRFRVDAVPAGPLCLLLSPPGQPPAVSAWFVG